MSTNSLKAIAPVPTASDFLDIILSKTQRKTPTVIHANFKISRIRNFYMRKIKFTQTSFDEKLSQILSEFPIVEDIHPFLGSLINVLYDKNHYKLALGQLRTAKGLIDQVGKDYVRLMKFGDSLYRCKQLKKAALGRMATIMRRQKDPLLYLEQVRQHLSRLPSIDPSTRTLLICGFPNVGKSSFINSISRADVDVQPYAFTTKSLFVGHFDYRYLRWQVVDTPGVLDRPVEDMGRVEMLSVTALAHLRAVVMFFIDMSEACGWSVEQQCNLYKSLSPLFTAKPHLLVLNKSDLCPLSSLAPDSPQLIALNSLLKEHPDLKHKEISCNTQDGVQELKNFACDVLLEWRVDKKIAKLKTAVVDGEGAETRGSSVLNRIHVAVPMKRDDVDRKPFIPEGAAARKKYDKDDPEKRRLLKDREAEEGGAGVFNINLKEDYILKLPEWKEDVIPEIMDGKNIADFIDPDIMEKLEALEKEEERLVEGGFYDHENEEDMEDSDEELLRQHTQSQLSSKQSSQFSKKATKNHARLPRTTQLRTLSELSTSLKDAGLDPSRIEERAAGIAKVLGVKRKRAMQAAMEEEGEGEDVDMEDSDLEDDSDEDAEDDGMDIDTENGRPADKRRRLKDTGESLEIKGGLTTKRVPRSDRLSAGMRDKTQIAKAIKLRNLHQRGRNRMAKAGESDRAIRVKMPKHLFAGKRKMGKTQRR